MKQSQFKADMDSITYADVLKVRELKAKHAIDLESLDMPLKLGNEYVEVMREFLDSLSYSSERIDSFEWRGRDGFIPHSWNHGGLQGITYRDQYSACEQTGFENTDAVLAKYYQYDVDSFCDDNGIPKGTTLTDEQDEKLNEYRQNGDETIQFQARIMMTSSTTANVDFYVSASDSPYHRSSDDKLELEIEFKSPAGMKRKLATILKHAFVQCLKRNVREGF